MTHVVAQCKLNIHQHQRTLASMMPAATSTGMSAAAKAAHQSIKMLIKVLREKMLIVKAF